LIVGLTHFIVEAPIMLILILGASLFFNCCIALLFLKWLLSCTNTKSLQVLLAVFVCYILLTTGVLGLARYRIGIAPMLWVACVLYVTPRFTRQ
jgi:hypothetical protein